jgi:tetratricopeptide (TPR) repeat protein
MFISGQNLPNLISRFSNPVGIEIGLSAGHTTKHLFDNISGLKLYGIDPYPDYIDWNGDDLDVDRQKSAYDEFLENTDDFKDSLTHYKLFSDEAAKEIEDNSCDFVFIDGLHTYSQVLKDCSNFYAKIKDGGLFAGHDYNAIPDVNRAVNDFASAVGATIMQTENDVWYWFKPKNVPIVTCTVNDKTTPVLASSVNTYCPGVDLIINRGERTNFGSAFNKAMFAAFEDHDEIIIANDDIVLNPNSYKKLMDDVAILLAEHGDKLGFVAAHSDSAFPVQNIRYQQGGNYELDRNHCQWTWEKEVRPSEVVAPLFAWISKKAFQEAQFPPLNWYSDDVICRDLGKKGFKHFISRSYIHHVGSQTVGQDFNILSTEPQPWLRANRPDYADMWFGKVEVEEPKKPIKICVYAISKNEEQFVARFCESAKDADLILIADTGSTDNTVKEGRKSGAVVHEICITPWRFDHARNAAIALIPKDIDVCVSIDLDEMLEPGWREEIERVWDNGVTRMRYLYDWGGNVTFYYEKIHARHGYYWHHPCHEYPRPDARINEKYSYTNKLLVTHHPDPTKSRGQYLDLLALSVKEDPICPRNAFYYARELSFYSKWDEAIVELQRYLDLPTATWHHERCYAMRTMAKCYEGKNQQAEAETWLLRAAAEAPSTREPWVALANLYYNQGRWQDCYGAAMRALSIKDKELVYTVDPSAWGWQPHDFAAIAAWHLGLKSIAAEQGQLALDLAPEDGRLKANLTWYTS